MISGPLVSVPKFKKKTCGLNLKEIEFCNEILNDRMSNTRKERANVGSLEKKKIGNIF